MKGIKEIEKIENCSQKNVRIVYKTLCVGMYVCAHVCAFV